MTKNVVTRRQKDVSRLLRERRQVHQDKLKTSPYRVTDKKFK